MSTRNFHYFLLTLILILACVAGWLGWMLINLSPEKDDRTPDQVSDHVEFELGSAPEIVDVEITNPPLYLYAFTHTEDHINHALSEARYWQIGQMVEELTAEFPGLPFSWMIEFQGADAKTVTDRNDETGLVDYLLSLNEQGFVEFGYHAHHDPNYNNRPQKELGIAPSFQEVYSALKTWVTCEKDPLLGGCVESTGGGLQAILNTFGQVEIVTGVGYDDGFLIERSAGSQVIKNYLPERLLGFGLPDHGAAIRDQGYSESRNALLALLTPTHETSSGTYWMDNAVRINDGVPLDGIESIRVRDGARSAQRLLEGLDAARPHVLNVGLADKYIYTKTGTSPTKWAYANVDDPELPEEWLNSEQEIAKNYTLTEEGLRFLMEYMSEQVNGSQFVSSDEVVDLFTSEDYWEVDADELEQIALWIVNEWDDAPPEWVYDGEDFYSLTDAWMLLTAGLNNVYLEQGPISTTYAPWSGLEQITDATNVAYEDIIAFVDEVSVIQNRLDVAHEIGEEYLSLTQSLYAMAYAYAMKAQGVATGMIEIPAVDRFPESYHLLEELGCGGCFDTTWSLKPARFQD